jgi:hypothetical protein
LSPNVVESVPEEIKGLGEQDTNISYNERNLHHFLTYYADTFNNKEIIKTMYDAVYEPEN